PLVDIARIDIEDDHVSIKEESINEDSIEEDDPLSREPQREEHETNESFVNSLAPKSSPPHVSLDLTSEELSLKTESGPPLEFARVDIKEEPVIIKEEPIEEDDVLSQDPQQNSISESALESSTIDIKQENVIIKEELIVEDDPPVQEPQQDKQQINEKSVDFFMTKSSQAHVLPILPKEELPSEAESDGYRVKCSKDELKRRRAQKARQWRKIMKKNPVFRQKEIERVQNYRRRKKTGFQSQDLSSQTSDSSQESNLARSNCSLQSADEVCANTVSNSVAHPHKQSSLDGKPKQPFNTNQKLNSISKKPPKTVKERVKDYRRRKRKLEAEKNRFNVINVINQHIANKMNTTQVQNIESSPLQSIANQELILDNELFFGESLLPFLLRGHGVTTNHASAHQQIVDLTSIEKFMAYTENRGCAEQKIRKVLDKNLPSRPKGNCLFYCLIKICDLGMKPTELRRILSASPHIHDCENPEEAKRILASKKEFGDADVIFIFSRHYKCNVCIHWHLRGRTLFFQIKSDEDNPYFIHLRLEGNHFELYIPSPRRKVNLIGAK
ncbi:hypothetical protein QAD02_018019, partial [Eretmocerus hayati]